MTPENAAAHALVAALAAVGVAGRVSEGVHWKVEVASAGSRALDIHCFWYAPEHAGLMLGINPSNARRSLDTPRAPHEGAQYLVVLRDGARVADGRTSDAREVVACARAWVDGRSVDGVVAVAPFVDRRGRAMRALAAGLDPRLRWEIGGEPAYPLWVYGDGRSCEVVGDDEGRPSCSFVLVQAQVALALRVKDVPGATSAWLLDRVRVGELASHVPGVGLERHAERIEQSPTEWHWLHVRDRIADPEDILARLRAPIEALAASPIATQFYSFSSLHWLCFSASSHYPWVRDGLPVMSPLRDGSYAVDEERYDLAGAVASIEKSLAASSVRPFFGSAPHYEHPRLCERLAKLGSALQPRLVQRGAWYSLVVDSGVRHCKVSGSHTTFTEGSSTLQVSWESEDAATSAIRRCLEDGESFDALAADPSAKWVSRGGLPY